MIALGTLVALSFSCSGAPSVRSVSEFSTEEIPQSKPAGPATTIWFAYGLSRNPCQDQPRGAQVEWTESGMGPSLRTDRIAKLLSVTDEWLVVQTAERPPAAAFPTPSFVPIFDGGLPEGCDPSTLGRMVFKTVSPVTPPPETFDTGFLRTLHYLSLSEDEPAGSSETPSDSLAMDLARPNDWDGL